MLRTRKMKYTGKKSLRIGKYGVVKKDDEIEMALDDAAHYETNKDWNPVYEYPALDAKSENLVLAPRKLTKKRKVKSDERQ